MLWMEIRGFSDPTKLAICSSRKGRGSHKTGSYVLHENEIIKNMQRPIDPEILAAEIAENLQSALEQFNSIIEELKENKNPS